MRKHPRSAPSPALGMSLIALFVASGGTAYAVTTLPKNSVGTTQLKNDAVTAPKIKNGAVTASKIAAPEAWHEVGASGQPAFENGWTNDNAATEATAGFYKDPFGVVHLKGRVANGINAGIFTLPAGYRPGKKVAELAPTNGGAGIIELRPDGSVVPIYGSGLFSLDGITFRAGE